MATLSIVIPAHNEGSLIARSLDSLLSRETSRGFEIVVVANGCEDQTADIAAARSVRVLSIPETGKARALNAAEKTSTTFPRVYLDADILLSPEDVERLVAQLGRPGPAGRKILAAVPRRHVNTIGRPRLIRMYYTVSVLHPAYHHGLFGRGAIALSREGRLRFVQFPEIVADDLFLDSLFTVDEKAEAWDVISTVEAPERVRELIRRLARVRRGNAELRSHAEQIGGVRPVSSLGWLCLAVLKEPGLMPSAVAYLGITFLADFWGRSANPGWGAKSSVGQYPEHKKWI